MKRSFFSYTIGCLLICFAACFPCISNEEDFPSLPVLKEVYDSYSREPSDINEHLPHLRQLARECSSVVEIGVRSLVSTWGILLGLSESSFTHRTYTGIDLHYPPTNKYFIAEWLAGRHGISFQFWKVNDMDIEIAETDFLFIDSLHTYCHLTYELEKFSPFVRKYIAMHDTSPPWGYCDDAEYAGDYSEYPATIDRNKRGLWQAVEDFLERHPDWSLYERYYNNHGFTILKRTSIGD